MDMTPTELSQRVGISPSYAWELMNGKRRPSRSLALQIFDVVGAKIGPLAGLSDDEIAVVRKMESAA